MESTTEILPTLLRIWERERTINLGSGTDRHVAWCHGFVHRLALNMTDEQKAEMNRELSTYLEIINRPI